MGESCWFENWWNFFSVLYYDVLKDMILRKYYFCCISHFYFSFEILCCSNNIQFKEKGTFRLSDYCVYILEITDT